MKLFADTADLEELEYLFKAGLVDGITTNPTILKKAGFKDPLTAWNKILDLKSKYIAKPISLSAEVFTDSKNGMVEQARQFVKALNYEGTTIKIPILGADGEHRLSVIKTLADERITVNCTGCITWFQAFAAAKAGARYVSLLYRRIIDSGLDGKDMIRRTRTLLDMHALNAEIIVGSIRKYYDVLDAYEAGAHIITVPPKFFPELLYHKKSVETQEQFLRDAESR